jgi:hypothetical protein
MELSQSVEDWLFLGLDLVLGSQVKIKPPPG